jgi:hypothetical protein
VQPTAFITSGFNTPDTFQPHKGKTLDALERFFTYRTSKSKPMMNEKFTTDSNVLFDMTVKRDRQN